MPHFNKRHYQHIAWAMQHTIEGCNSSEQVSAVWRAIGEMARVFEIDNPLFKRSLFLQACQPGANVRATKVKAEAQAAQLRSWGVEKR